MPCGCHERRQIAHRAYQAALRGDGREVVSNASAMHRSMVADAHRAVEGVRSLSRHVPVPGRYNRP